MKIAISSINSIGFKKIRFYFLIILGFGLLTTNLARFASAADTPAVRFVGNFSSVKMTKDHRYGSQVVLWQVKNTVVGLYYNADGQNADVPRGVLQNVKLNPKSGSLYFEAKLTTGLHNCDTHKNVPSQDLFIFNGILRKNTLKGRLTQKDALHDTEIYSNAKVSLKHEIQPHYDSYESMEDWQKFIDAQLKQFGPQW